MSEIKKEVVGTAFSFVVGLTDNQQITFQSGFAEDETDDVVNARIDRLRGFAQRAQLLAEVPSLKDERAKLLDQQLQTRSDEARLDADYERQVKELNDKVSDTFDVGYAEHARSGKQTAYEPRGAAKQTIVNCTAALEKMKAERDVVMQQRETFHKRVDARVAEIDEKLAEAAKLEGT